MSAVVLLTADPRGKYIPSTINILNINESIVWDVTDFDFFKLQETYDTAMTLGTLVLKIQQSLDGANPEDFSTPVTLSAKGITALLDVTAVNFIHATVTTVGTAGTIRLIGRAQKQTRT